MTDSILSERSHSSNMNSRAPMTIDGYKSQVDSTMSKLCTSCQTIICRFLQDHVKRAGHHATYETLVASKNNNCYICFHLWERYVKAVGSCFTAGRPQEELLVSYLIKHGSLVHDEVCLAEEPRLKFEIDGPFEKQEINFKLKAGL
jgi:hypothetical protein